MESRTILVVDDEIGIRELLSEILFDEGYQVYLAENAEQARAYRNEHEPNLVLLDIWMPDTDGITLLREWVEQDLLTMPALQKLLSTIAKAIMDDAPKLKKQMPEAQGQKIALNTGGRELQISLPMDLPLREARDHFDALYFDYHLQKEAGNVSRVAENVGLERTHLYRKLKQLGIKFVKKGSVD